MNIKKYILFDLDGTVTDPMIGITKSVRYALNKFEIYPETLEELCKFIGPPLKESFMKYYDFSEEEGEKAVEFYREYFSVTGLYENKVYEHMESLLKGLKQQKKTLIIATSKPTVFAEKILDHFNLSQYFEAICGSNLDGTRVHKGDVIAYALERCGIENPQEAVMIGDREYDIKGAKEQGIEAIGVTYGYGDRSELEQAGGQMIVDTVEELSMLFA